MARQVINTFTKSGKVVSGTRRAGVATSPLGKLDPATGRVWQKPRLKADPLVGGSAIRTTNPKATAVTRNTMTGSIGMGGVGQRGRTRDVGATKARGEA
jgi:hypothetical protein